LKALDIHNLPTPKEEHWKYTNLPAAIPRGLKLVTTAREEVIHIKHGQVCEQLKDIQWTGADNQHLQPRLQIILEDNAMLRLFERHTGQGSYWKNMVTHITLGENARLIHYRLQDDAAEAVHTNMVSINLSRSATYEAFSINSGSQLSRHQIQVNLEGEGASCRLNGIKLLRGTQVGDTTITIDHQAPFCSSHQNYRSVLDGQSCGVFQGKVHVHPVAQKTDGFQKSDTLILSEGAQMNTKPELEIYADDVKCSHGTTTGKLDDTPLFYMRSRGIPEAQARTLLIEAFVGEIADNIPDEIVQSMVSERIRQWLVHST
jgi:Fe-S cluster assembly protein SufD